MDKKKILLVSLGHLSCDVNGGALPAALPYVRSAYNLDYQATGGLIFAYSCLSSLIQPLFGWLADRHNKPWFIPVGVALAGCGISIMAFIGNYWIIFAGIAISGIGSAFFHPEAARFANRVSGKQKGAGLSFFSIGGNTGFILGPLLVTLFAGLFGLAGMSVFAILGLATATILFLTIYNMQGTSPMQKATGPNSAPAESKNNWHEFSKLIFVIIARAIVFTGCNTFIPLYWISAFGQDKTVGALALVVFGACGVAFNVLGGFLSDKIGYVNIIRIAFCAMPVTVFCFGWTDSLWLAWLLLPLLGFSLYLPFSSQVVLGQQLLAKNMGFASGITLGLATTLGGIAQPGLGWIADHHGLHAIFFTLAALALLGFGASLCLKRNG